MIKNISDLCYELYKLDWIRRISAERQMDAMKDWYQEVAPEDREDISPADWIFDQGYQGELYVCKDEFLGAEFLNEEYIKGILDNDELFAEYKSSFKKGVDSGNE